MKIRPIRAPCEYEGSPNTRDIAERAFLRALKREARGTNKAAPSLVRGSTLGSAAPKPRTNGQALGRAFAPLNAASYDQAVTFARAIEQGFEQAVEKDREDWDLAQDDDVLRAMGFGGPGDDF